MAEGQSVDVEFEQDRSTLPLLKVDVGVVLFETSVQPPPSVVMSQ
jgi:hypothetical protein